MYPNLVWTTNITKATLSYTNHTFKSLTNANLNKPNKALLLIWYPCVYISQRYLSQDFDSFFPEHFRFFPTFPVEWLFSPIDIQDGLCGTRMKRWLNPGDLCNSEQDKSCWKDTDCPVQQTENPKRQGQKPVITYDLGKFGVTNCAWLPNYFKINLLYNFYTF
jgi:hypothetical protein